MASVIEVPDDGVFGENHIIRQGRAGAVFTETGGIGNKGSWFQHGHNLVVSAGVGRGSIQS